MATLSRGVTYASTETITNTKLHNLVDLGSITNIVDADISNSANIADTKLADITTGGKVRGSSLYNLASIVSGAGTIPSANIPILGSTMISLVSIPNASLLPLTLASWVDGASLRNLASIPSTAGQFSYYNLVASLASGGLPVFNGTSNFVGKNIAQILPTQTYTLLSTTTVTNSTSSSNITISSGKTYKVVLIVINNTGTSPMTLKMLVNSDSTGNDYRYYNKRSSFATTPTETASGSSGTTFLRITNGISADPGYFTGEFTLSTSETSTNATVFGQGQFGAGSGGLEHAVFSGDYNGGTATSFSIFSDNTFNGTIYLYEISHT